MLHKYSTKRKKQEKGKSEELRNCREIGKAQKKLGEPEKDRQTIFNKRRKGRHCREGGALERTRGYLIDPEQRQGLRVAKRATGKFLCKRHLFQPSVLPVRKGNSSRVSQGLHQVLRIQG